MKNYAFLLGLALLGATAGCTHNPAIDAPNDFAQLNEDPQFDFRATNASGVVLAVRSEENAPQGNLEFWSRALEHRLNKAGYKQKSADKITSTEGLVGRRLSYELKRGGRTHLYVATVFVTESTVYVVEAGGDEAYFDKPTKESIERAVATLRTS